MRFDARSVLCVSILAVAGLCSAAESPRNIQCTVGEQFPVYGPNNPAIIKYEFERLETAVRESIETKDGLIADIRHGGCAHYGFTVRFQVSKPEGTAVTDAEVFEASLDFLARLRSVDPEVGRVSRMYLALSAYENPQDYKLGEEIVETAGYSFFTVDRDTSASGAVLARYVVIP